jgi:hypothetical protein
MDERDRARRWLAGMGVLLLAAGAAQARVTRIVIDETRPLPAADSGGIAFEQVAGRAFGELDPASPANRIVNDIQLVREADGKVRYVATFVLTKPVDLARASGLLWHEVPNRGLRRPNVVAERANGDIDLTSAWQGDNAGATAVRATMGVAEPHWLQLPIARNADGSPVTGEVFGRIVNRGGPGLAAADRADQPGAVQAGQPRHAARAPWSRAWPNPPAAR